MVGFAAPWILVALCVLPVLWYLLRATPPAPVRRRFPGVVLLLGLHDKTVQAARTPWWLLALRMTALAAVIVAFAGPVLNPQPVVSAAGPLLIVTDGSWASARDWPRRAERMRQAVEQAQAAGRPVQVLNLSDPPGARLTFTDATTLQGALPALRPQPWEPRVDVRDILPEGTFETLWLSDGLNRASRIDLVRALQARGPVDVWEPAGPVLALGRAEGTATGADVPVLSSAPVTGAVGVVALGPDPSGVDRELARTTVDGAGVARFDLPPELRNRVTRFAVADVRSAGAVTLGDDSLRRRKVALIGSDAREGLALLSPLHYLREALAPSADLIGGTLADALVAKPDVIVLADIGTVAEHEALAAWVRDGGLLIRFAGPRLAGTDTTNDALLPVPLRQGGRSVGGTMSWGELRHLAPFPEGPFAGLVVPDDVSVREQVMAEPGPDLANQTIAALTDGTPLVTRAPFGRGSVVLFHVSADAGWSNLPLSGLFPQMLTRLSVTAGSGAPEPVDLAGQTWTPVRLMDAFGTLTPIDTRPGVAGERLAAGPPGPDLPPGIYANAGRSVALNALARGETLAAAQWPSDIAVDRGVAAQPMPLKGLLLAVALGLILVDTLAALGVAGRLRRGVAVLAVGLFAAGFGAPHADAAPTTMPVDRAVEAASNVVFGYIPSGDDQVDQTAQAGLEGLSQILRERTTVEPSVPMRIDLATDDLALFTLLYWPITEDTPSPTPDEYVRLNRFLRTGGMIVFDTRDADLAEASGSQSPAARRLQAIAAPLEIPPLAPIPPDHILTRTFYLLQDFPGRYTGPIWVEAASPDAEQADGMPFRDLNDGVTPVVVGGNDWAGAWALAADGMPMFPVGRGSAGERQREVAYRFGVNLVMHVLTGNYKSDQVHVPALLERLGQ